MISDRADSKYGDGSQHRRPGARNGKHGVMVSQNRVAMFPQEESVAM